jgi:hypothetical protein
VIAALRAPVRSSRFPSVGDVDMFTDDDAQLALTVCYDLHYDGFEGVDDEWEWEPTLLELRRSLEHAFLERLFDTVGVPEAERPDNVLPELRAIAMGDGPSLSRYVLERCSLDEVREFCVHRSAYQRKEADPHTWVIPRLRGRAKATAVAIQYDEYGAGNARAMHAELFATTMRALALDPAPGAYVDLLPATTLATGNLITLFGLHRRWRAACVGHLALFEMTSVQPMQRYARTLRRLGLGESARRFYEVHVTADALHEQLAQHELVAGLLQAEPGTAGDILFGARALGAVESRFATRLVDCWDAGRTSLLAALPLERAAS